MFLNWNPALDGQISLNLGLSWSSLWKQCQQPRDKWMIYLQFSNVEIWSISCATNPLLSSILALPVKLINSRSFACSNAQTNHQSLIGCISSLLLQHLQTKHCQRFGKKHNVFTDLALVAWVFSPRKKFKKKTSFPTNSEGPRLLTLWQRSKTSDFKSKGVKTLDSIPFKDEGCRHCWHFSVVTYWLGLFLYTRRNYLINKNICQVYPSKPWLPAATDDSLKSEVLKTTSWHEPPKSWLIKIRSWNHELEKSGFRLGNRLLYDPTKFS